MASTDIELGHPPSVLRLASAVHRFAVPQMVQNKKISFIGSFKTAGSHEKTREVLQQADGARNELEDTLKMDKLSHERVAGDSKQYIPLIHQILLSCKIQPEVAQLDERLIFEWTSGIENEHNVYKSEALMFDLVMAIVCEGLGRAGSAVENSQSGEFAAASRDYAAAAGIFSFLANDHLPKWMANGSNVDKSNLPVECSVGVASALHSLFVASGQQMAVATILAKPGVPNYSLLAKLCLGVHEQLDTLLCTMRKDAFDSIGRMDEDFFTLATFQIIAYKSLSLYFQARSSWDKHDKGIAIALLRESFNLLNVGSSKAAPKWIRYELPDMSKNRAFMPLNKDIVDLRQHITTLSKAWESENSRIFFETVPQTLSSESKLQEGLKMNKQEIYLLDRVEPLLLFLPAQPYNCTSAPPPSPVRRSDSDLARELQKQLDQEENRNNISQVPASPLRRSDSDLARELQRQIDQEENRNNALPLPSSPVRRSDSDLARELQRQTNQEVNGTSTSGRRNDGSNYNPPAPCKAPTGRPSFKSPVRRFVNFLAQK